MVIKFCGVFNDLIIHLVGSEESLLRLNNRGDKMVEWSKALVSCKAVGPVPGSNPHNVHSIYITQPLNSLLMVYHLKSKTKKFFHLIQT